ncbi:hypothetical protein DUI87_17225 [Hirundo rustica rustica]|uniref:Uncharacterized protein n=1 Tax=Hirundo rustica rustica TaxID=333673 RepID=A0A3M0K379_HIRRU|nr:hypothetical protein DUI87_17215 [Hirundo rustica rustica]RMC07739.1 hypothetical protein DUI87_17219 [Hirundo rustica rustica]RMC07744.1 hypothetical protein DUI87_17225 [Hirundo rustica rustica]
MFERILNTRHLIFTAICETGAHTGWKKLRLSEKPGIAADNSGPRGCAAQGAPLPPHQSTTGLSIPCQNGSEGLSGYYPHKPLCPPA